MRFGQGFRDGDVRCGFMLNEQEHCCNKPGVTHFDWAGEASGVACVDHAAFARSSATDEHPIGPDCAMPGAVWQVYSVVMDDGSETRWSTCIFPLEHGLTATIGVALPELAMAGGGS